MSDIGERIGAWEAAGLIDRETADRLRAAEAIPAVAGVPPGVIPAGRPIEAPGPSTAAAWFGPGVTIPEVFGYLGAGFLLAAWSAFVVRLAGDGRENVMGAGSIAAAVVLVALAMWLASGDARRSRAAGVASLAAIAYATVGIFTFAATGDVDGLVAATLATGVGTALAAGLRVVHPGLLTQFGLLSALTSFAATLLARVESLVGPAQLTVSDSGVIEPTGPDPRVLALGAAIWWLVTAVVIGLIALRESQRAERGADGPASRRAALSRFWAGLVAVLGVASALTRTDALPGGDYGRVVPSWFAILAVLAVSAVLVERAFRRDATAYVYPAALGLIIALSDANVSYLSGGTEVALLVEGLILLGVGLAADRLRRRIGAPEGGQPGSPAPPAGSIDAPTTGEPPPGEQANADAAPGPTPEGTAPGGDEPGDEPGGDDPGG